MKKLNIKQKLSDKSGMTLIEVLTAITILTIFLGCFLPLLTSTTSNITGVGTIVKKSYNDTSLIQKLLGNTGANIGYSFPVNDMPLTLKLDEDTFDRDDGLSAITGDALYSDYNNRDSGYCTFVANSVTTSMYSYPSHISDDFLTKEIMLIATGFKFESESRFTVEYTDETGKLRTIQNNSRNYTIRIDRFDAKIAYLTLVGDNDTINFEKSPLVVTYDKNTSLGDFQQLKQIVLEIDAPTLIMVGKDAKNGYYFVSDGIPDEKGQVNIIRKKMNSKDANNNYSSVKLNSAMNDVKWIAPGDGDDGNGGTNKYGYYAMCGDNGQIRRFWRNTKNGNYFWGGDNVIDYEYSAPNGLSSAKETFNGRSENNNYKYDTTVNSSFLFKADPTSDGTGKNGILLDDQGMGKLYCNTAFTLNMAKTPGLDFWTMGSALYTDVGEQQHAHSYIGGTTENGIERKYLNYSSGSSTEWLERFKNRGGASNAILKNTDFNNWNSAVQRSAADAMGYSDFWKESSSNNITLTSVGGVNMGGGYSSGGANDKNPVKSYTLYCGYIPGVVDLWTPTIALHQYDSDTVSRWLATLGVGFVDNSTNNIYQYLDEIYLENTGRTCPTHWGTKTKYHYNGLLWDYTDVPTSSYALTGICGPQNYASSRSLANAHEAAKGDKINPNNVGMFQKQLQTQNLTNISFSYLSNPYAMGSKNITDSGLDISTDRDYYANIYQWTFEPGTTFTDFDNLTIDDGSGNDINVSLSVGYTLAGIENGYSDGVHVPTVMNNGVVFLRAGGKNNEKVTSGYKLTETSNVFHQLFYTDSYYNVRHRIYEFSSSARNVMAMASSAWYWRDKYHPVFYSVYGDEYNAENGRDRFSYLMGHILQDKKLTSVKWGATWNSSPDAMWGSSDGTVMSWNIDLEEREKTADKPHVTNKDGLNGFFDTANFSKYDYQSIICEFQSYSQWEKTKGKGTLYSRYKNLIGIGTMDSSFVSPTSVDDISKKLEESEADGFGVFGLQTGYLQPSEKNSFWDRCSIELGKTRELGFISSLKTVEDVEFSNDIWVAVGIQGQSRPIYSREKAVVGSGEGSWINVKSWYKQNPDSISPNINDKNYVWQAVKISNKENCNISQVNYAAGLWFATGYLDENKNGKYDDGENAVVFYAEDPTKPCGTDGGWKLSDPGGTKTHTQAWANENGSYKLVDIGGINSVDCRTD